MKRTLDILAACAGLVLFSPLLIAVAIGVKLSSPGPVWFKQERIGWGFRPFLICNFRPMVQDAPKLGGPITIGDDRRITRVGRLLRKTKMDELPQLLNVLMGDMSLVGPRPEARCYVEMFRQDYKTILQGRAA
jgi:lipopolysaccharide/colanic/teichoic acid biosynthesis glycosyltransferase